MKIEYNGAGFSGWQRQPDVPSIQGTIEKAIAKLDPNTVTVSAAGRTDAGVHAYGQVAHCDMQNDWEPERLMGAINYHLKPDRIAIIDCAKVDENWHARFSAGERQYVFRLVSRRAPVCHEAGLVWQLGHRLDVDAMRQAAEHLLGTHDFTTFRSTLCQAPSPIKTLDELSISQHEYPGGEEVRFLIRSRSFLHNQVRSFVGTLERVGSGRWHPDRVAKALKATDRTACGPVSPPYGLYLSHVVYDNPPFN